MCKLSNQCNCSYTVLLLVQVGDCESRLSIFILLPLNYFFYEYHLTVSIIFNPFYSKRFQYNVHSIINKGSAAVQKPGLPYQF